MEARPSYLITGLFVLLAGFGAAILAVWLVRADIDAQVDIYEVIFEGSVSGLQPGGTVQYRGVPVGRIDDIRIDDEDIAQIVATIEVDATTPVRADTYAQLVPFGVTGLTILELKGGMHDQPPLNEVAENDPPHIPARGSPLEQVFDTTPEVLNRAVGLLEQLMGLASQENLVAVGQILERTQTLTETLAQSSGEIETFIANAADASTEAETAAKDFAVLVSELSSIATTIDDQMEEIAGTTTSTLSDVSGAAEAFRNLAWRADTLLDETSAPLQDFAQSGLYDFTELVREMRALTASLSRISREFERDPTGFLLGGSQRGFTPQ